MTPRPRPGASRPRRWLLVRVRGVSMEPTLGDGDLVLARAGASPRVGDVVVADLPGGRGTGVKRAVHREDGGWWLERDSTGAGSDSWLFGAVADDAVLAVVRLRLLPRPGRLRPRPGRPDVPG
ncbi:S24/S26 family peptidase [Aquipuribacter sp. SD81]|uniref:S24/S26 family peptidase n=1 Tax=Aquipuribacter sp. SD81 TaxID=3127703 RepID=UPI003017ABD0